MKCEKCGMVCKDTQKFCLNCGNPLHPEEPEDIQEQLVSENYSMDSMTMMTTMKMISG